MDSPWVTTVQMTKYLKISRSTFDRMRDSFSKGTHYIEINPNIFQNIYKIMHIKTNIKFLNLFHKAQTTIELGESTISLAHKTIACWQK